MHWWLMNRREYEMKTLLSILFLSVSLCCFSADAAQQQPPKKFNPQQFEAELEQFITTEVGLTPQESSTFFPVYREMRKQQRIYFIEDRRFHHTNLTDDKACEEAIRRHAANELKIKEIQQSYHLQFLKMFPASKVFRIIRAEEKFHRHMMKRAAFKCHQKENENK